jgi:phage I-like protein
MKTIAIAILAACLTSCAGFNISAITPWGDVQSIDGATVITPKPVVIPSRK